MGENMTVEVEACTNTCSSQRGHSTGKEIKSGELLRVPWQSSYSAKIFQRFTQIIGLLNMSVIPNVLIKLNVEMI